MGRQNHPTPRVIHTDGHGAYPPAIAQLKTDGVLDENCRHRVRRYPNNLVEQDHRAIKRQLKASQHFRSFWGAWRTLAGYEAAAMIRKDQAFGSSSDGRAVPLHAYPWAGAILLAQGFGQKAASRLGVLGTRGDETRRVSSATPNSVR
ncbi:MAG: DDE-type integrase/transposase/recombinase, partial [Acidobacteriaceae bacterium]|nr:DDE-type integrase/transposase/recombinase [Acidobacteriaceae bacterium]